MKRKVAVALAAIMALSPISAFAATKNELTKQPTNVVDKTLFMGETWRYDGMVNLKEANLNGSETDRTDATTDDIKYAVDGTTLELSPLAGKSFKVGDTFKVSLSNANWFFRNLNGVTVDNNQAKGLFEWFILNTRINVTKNAADSYVLNRVEMNDLAIRNGVPRELWDQVRSILPVSNFGFIVDTINANTANPVVAAAIKKLLVSTSGDVELRAIADYYAGTETTPGLSSDDKLTLKILFGAVISANYPSLVTAYNNLVKGEFTSTLENQDNKLTDAELVKALQTYTQNTAYYNGKALSTYNSAKGSYFPTNNLSGSTGTYVQFDDTTDPKDLWNQNYDNVDYILTVSESNNSVATVRIMRETDDLITIPVVSLTKGSGDVRVEVAPESNTSIVSRENMLYGQTASSNTKTTVKTKIDSKYTFYLDQLIIAEQVPDSLQRGQIILTAPYGFRWADPTKKTKIYNEDTEKYEDDKYVEVIADEDLYFAGNKTLLSNEGGKFVQQYETTRSTVTKNYTDRLVIDTNAMELQHSGRTTGKLVVKGLCLLAEDYAPLNEEIKVEIRDYDGDTEDKNLTSLTSAVTYSKTKSRVSKENVVVGNRKDWGVKFERISDVTTLVSGRFENLNNSTEFDKEHQTANVKFSENVVASWWALRESEFTLTDGVKFRKVEIYDEENFDHTNTRFDDLEDTYYPSKDRKDYVLLDATKLRIVDLEIKRDKTASFKMKTWVSIEPGFEGDIELKAGGNDILKETTPVVIAKAVAPITLTSKVKDVKIGYQWQKVEDITITETAAGRLKRDTELRLFVDDDITGSDSIAIAPDFVTEVNDTSNIKFSKPAVDGGEVSMNIERASYKTPATIKLSNVYVKIDRTVPESNKRPYKIVAGGTAIAANYVGNNGYTETYTDANGTVRTRELTRAKLAIQSDEALFATKGIGVDYLNVVTSAPDKDSILSNIVTVKNGSNELKVGNTTVTMDTEAFISAESNSMMVPVRFVAVALGIADDQVKWDNEARTVTIYNGARVIQFTLGKSEIIVNGVKSTIYSPDVPPIKVNAEVKDNRSFLPFRALGTALGVDVDYDATTQAATYNAGLLKDNAKAAAAEATTPAATTTTPATTPAK